MTITRKCVSIFITGLLLSSGIQASTTLGTSILSFSASGSPNTISGGWSANALDTAQGPAIDYYTLEIVSFTSGFGPAVALSFNSSFPGNSTGLSFGTLCPIGASCIGQPTLGSTTTVLVNGTQQYQALDFLQRLDLNSARFTNYGQASVSFGSGGGTTTANGEIKITAFSVSSVPKPSTASLMLSALVLFSVVFGRRFTSRGKMLLSEAV